MRMLCKIMLAVAVVATLSLGGPSVASVRAGSITYVTPSGSTAGGQPVNAEADITTSSGSITIVLRNLLANPTSVVQNLSDLSFTVGQGSLTGSTETGASAQKIDVAADRTF